MKDLSTPAPAGSLRDALVAELAMDPNVDVWRIGLDADDGVVRLTGSVEFIAIRVVAERPGRRTITLTVAH